MANIDAEVIIKFKVKYLLDTDDNIEDFGFDNLKDYVKWLLDEEGIMGVVEDDYTILEVTKILE